MSDLNDLLDFEIPALLREKVETKREVHSISIHLIDYMFLTLMPSDIQFNTVPELQRLIGKERRLNKSATL